MLAARPQRFRNAPPNGIFLSSTQVSLTLTLALTLTLQTLNLTLALALTQTLTLTSTQGRSVKLDHRLF